MKDELKTGRTSANQLALLGSVYLVIVSLMVFLNLWFVPSEVWRPAYVVSHGIVHPTLIAGLVTMVIVCGPIVVAGRVRLSTMGLKTATLVRGIVATAVWWSLLQAVAGISSLSTGGGLHITQQWSPAVATLTVGALAAQLLGNALAEETIYRGFFLPRLVTVFVERGFRRPVALGVLLSSIAFALPHVPNRLLKGQTDLAVIVVDQVLLVLAGMMFGWAYWRTRNLFVCVGLHSVINQPSMLIAGPQDWPSTVWPYSTYGALLTYAWLFPSPRTGSLTETAL